MTPTIPQIIAAVADRFEVTPADIAGYSRIATFTHPRFAVCALAKLAGYSLAQIGARLSNRDHTSIIHAQRRALAICDSDSEYRAKFAALRKALIGKVPHDRQWVNAGPTPASTPYIQRRILENLRTAP